MLAPSLLSADFGRLEEQIALTEEGGADLVHLDIMDGQFVPNISFGGPVVRGLEGKTKLPFDVHLMIVHPEQRIPDFVTGQTEYITVHQEACPHLDRVIHQIKELGIRAAVALNPATPVDTLKYVLPKLDMVLIMSVNPGFSGQKYIPYAKAKVRELAEIRKKEGFSFKIEIDGGVSLSNAPELKAAGVDIFVAGNAVYKADNIPQRCREFKKITG